MIQNNFGRFVESFETILGLAYLKNPFHILESNHDRGLCEKFYSVLIGLGVLTLPTVKLLSMMSR